MPCPIVISTIGATEVVPPVSAMSWNSRSVRWQQWM
jgi:hypothetical protein